MKTQPLLQTIRSVSFLFATATFTQAVQYGPQNFAVPDGTTDLGDGSVLASSDGSAAVQVGVLQMSRESTAGTHSSLRLPALASSADGWTASFDFILDDSPGGAAPADGFSFSYGAIPAFNPAQGDPSAADAHGQAEAGWHPGVSHLAFGFSNSAGFSISLNGTELVSDNQAILTDGQTVVGIAVLSWDPDLGASMSVDTGLGIVSIFANVATPGFTGNNAHGFALSARTGDPAHALALDNVQVTTIPPGFVVLPNPVISEFMADNESTIEDEDCRTSDWLEVFNSTADPINLDGWYLTDDPAELTKWRIPNLPLAPNARQLIFASGKDQTVGQLHTDFQIDKDGGFLALVKPDGVTIASVYNYGQQVGDISYGTLGQAQTLGSFSTATPGTLNVAPQGDLVLEKPLFSLENQLISGPVQLELSTTVPDATIRYTTNLTTPTAASPAYSTPIAISNTTRVTARLFVPGKEPGPVRDRTFVRLAADMATVRSEVPLIIIDSFGRNIDGEARADSQNPLRPVHGIFIDRDPATGKSVPSDLPDFQGRAGMRVRGQTSSGFAKKQYSFETWDSEGNDKDVSIFGMPSESDWVIHAPYSDKTLMRNKIVYDTSHEMGYPAVRTKFCELYFNSNGGDVSTADYRGVYVFMEKIKGNEDRVRLKKLEACDNSGSAISGGYMFKKDKGSPPGQVTFYTARESHRMEIIEPNQPTSAQRNWIDNYMDGFENVLHGGNFAHPTAGYARYLDVKSFIDTHLWVELYKNIDGYRLSSYFHKDRGRKIVASPVWDYNLSLGNANYLGGEFSSGWYYTQLSSGDYPWYGRLFQDPNFVIQYWDRWFELREGIFSNAELIGRISLYEREIARPALRNFNKWPVLGTYLWPNAGGYQARTSHRSEVTWMRNWVTARLAWIDSQHTKPPTFNQAGGPIGSGLTLTISNVNPGGGTIYYTNDGSDPRNSANNGVSGTAQVYSGALPLNSSQTVRARVRNGTSWSPLQTEYYLLNGVPASAANIAVTEIGYRPPPAILTEANVGFDQRGDFEFAEIMNIGPLHADLAGVRFAGGIEFNFDLGDVKYLAPGERAVVVSNRDAFARRYAAQLSGIRIAGEFTNNLSNDGETILLTDATGAAIRSFTYNDKDPWPEAADGDGPTLALIAPMSDPDHNDPLNWRSSLTPNGTPGQSDGTLFSGDPTGDDDANGISNLLQYALAPPGVEPTLPSTWIGTFTVGETTNDYMTFAYTRNIAADDILFLAEISQDLVNWTNDTEGVFTVLNRVENGDGTETITYRINDPVADADQLYARLSVQMRTP